MPQSLKDYLGDSVYADFDGYAVTLTTENGKPNDPSNLIVLEPDVIAALNRYYERVTSIAKEPHA